VFRPAHGITDAPGKGFCRSFRGPGETQARDKQKYRTINGDSPHLGHLQVILPEKTKVGREKMGQ
jgi:hypothetical protein